MKVKEESEKVGLKLNIQKTKIMAKTKICPCFMANRGGNSGNSGLQNHCRWWLKPWNWKMLVPWKKSYDQPRKHIKKQRYYFADKGLSSQSYGFSSSHVWMWELDHKESEWWRIYPFELWLGRLLRVPWTARRSVLSIHWKDWCWSWNSNTLATWCEH